MKYIKIILTGILFITNAIAFTQPVLDLKVSLQAFYPLQHDAAYSISVCADLPVNDNPSRVFKKGEPGHVFLILVKKDSVSGKTIEQSFGFYPRVPVSCLVAKVRSVIRDNSNREYDAALQKQVTPDEFALILEQCINLSKKKYNLKKFNCYDYVLAVFNSLPGVEKLPLTRVKFPFIFGRGGSPCGLYKDLSILATGSAALSPLIKFGSFRSPMQHSPELLLAAF